MTALSSEEMKEYRRNNPEYVERERLREKAKRRAMTRIRDAHFLEYRRFLSEELAKVGIKDSF